MAAALAEVVAGNPSTIYDARGNTITARVQRSINTDADMQPAGFFEAPEIAVTVPIAELPSTEPAEKEELLVDAKPYHVNRVHRREGVSNKYFCGQKPQSTHNYFAAADGSIFAAGGYALTT